MHRCLTILVLALAIPLSARAQTTPATTGTTTTTTTTAATTAAPQSIFSSGAPNRWVLSGFIGQNFGASTDGSSTNFGGSLSYLHHGAFGGEFLADFTPKFKMQNSAILLGERPEVNSYMANAIAAIPFHNAAGWSPYVSGGLGAVAMRLDRSPNSLNNVTEPDDTKFGGNIGGGLMGFAGIFGLRADVRYFRAFKSTDSTPSSTTNIIAGNLLNGLDFWRANVGLAIRW